MRNLELTSFATVMALAVSAPIAATAQAAPPRTAGDAVYTSNLVTRWGRQVTPDNAWPSYPRPQMVRSRWQNLNGSWDYAITPQATAEPARMDGKILVPFPIESRLSGVARRVTPTDRIWYRRSFTIDDGWRGQDVILHFGAVDFSAQIWVNGAPVGSHRGGSDTFSFDITPYLKPGANTLSVQVADPTSSGAQPRGKQTLEPQGIWYTAVSGIWQTVWLEPVPKLRIEDVHVVPDIDSGSISVAVALNHAAADDDAVRLTASAKGKTVAKTIIRANREGRFAIPQAHLWSPDDPYLYDLKVELVKVEDPLATAFAGDKEKRRQARYTRRETEAYAAAKVVGTSSDSVQSYFGMRKIAIGPGKVPGQPSILLNNKPVFQLGTLDQGWWPDGLLTPPSEEAMTFDMAVLKRAGFNMLRKHIKVEPAQYYAAADRMGLLIWQDMPSGEETADGDHFVVPDSQTEAVLPPDVTADFTSELAHMIGDLRAFPSIVTWVVNNEGWGQYDSATLARFVKGADPSRIVNADSGWLDAAGNVSDMLDIHSYEEVPNVPRRQEHRAIVIGEYGGIGLPIAGHMWHNDKRNWGYQTAHDAADYAARYQRKLDEVARQARELGLSAAVYTQTTDVEDEINGIMTYDREATKIPEATLSALNSKVKTP